MNILIKKIIRLLAVFSMLFFKHNVMASYTYGYVEKIKIRPGNTVVKAKLDTGAVSASLNAINVKIIKRNKQKWVSFDIPLNEGLIHLERKLLRFVHIKKRRSEMKKVVSGSSTRRPVVKMRLTLGCQTKLIDINLANRQAFNYPLLLGRKSLIMFDVIVDPAKAFVSTLKEHGCL